MGCKTNCAIFVVVVSVSVAVIPTLVSRYLFSVGEPPLLEVKQWWGRGQEMDDEPEGTTIKEFSISLSDEVLNDLKERLSKTYFFENLEGIDWEYGTNPDYVKELVEYWRTTYDWRRQEELLNTYKHYKTKISGLDVHFLHYKPEVKEGQRLLPIMLVHGWPGSFYEFFKVIPKLIAASTDDYAFSVICPSIPGYGLSEAPHKPGFEAFAAGRIFCKLMKRLGYESYYIQGGDWGSAITRAMALMNPSFVMVPRPFTSVQALGSQTCTDVIQPSGMTGVWNESLVISALPDFCKRESLMFTDFLWLHPIRQTFQRV